MNAYNCLSIQKYARHFKILSTGCMRDGLTEFSLVWNYEKHNRRNIMKTMQKIVIYSTADSKIAPHLKRWWHGNVSVSKYHFYEINMQIEKKPFGLRFGTRKSSCLDICKIACSTYRVNATQQNLQSKLYFILHICDWKLLLKKKLNCSLKIGLFQWIFNAKQEFV